MGPGVCVFQIEIHVHAVKRRFYLCVPLSVSEMSSDALILALLLREILMT